MKFRLWRQWHSPLINNLWGILGGSRCLFSFLERCSRCRLVFFWGSRRLVVDHGSIRGDALIFRCCFSVVIIIIVHTEGIVNWLHLLPFLLMGKSGRFRCAFASETNTPCWTNTYCLLIRFLLLHKFRST